MDATFADRVVFGLFLVFLAGVILFAVSFRTTDSATTALARIRHRVAAFRWGFLPLLTGIALLAEGQAIKWRADVPITHPAILAFHVAGYALLIAGVVVVNVVVWRPHARRPKRGPRRVPTPQRNR